MRKAVIVVIALGVAILFAGFFIGYIESSEKSSNTYNDYFKGTLSPSAERLIPIKVNEKDSLLNITLSANSTLAVKLMYGDSVEFQRNGSNFRWNLLLLEAGDRTVKILNDGNFTCGYFYIITLTERIEVPAKPFIWLREPLLIAGAFTISIGVPAAYLSSKSRKRWKGWLIDVAILALALFTVVYMQQVVTLALHTSTPVVTIVSRSMEPTIQVGDLVIVTGIQPETLHVGDIIIFNKVSQKLGGTIITLDTPIVHRIVDLYNVGGKFYFKTKGDNNQFPDEEYVPDDGVLGKVAFVIPKVGYLISLLQTMEAKISLVLFAAFLIIGWPALKTSRSKKSG